MNIKEHLKPNMKNIFLGLALLATALAAHAQSWTNFYDGPLHSDDYARAAALDKNGNVFVTGTARVSGGFQEIATIKYSNAGSPLWTNVFAGAGFDGDYPLALAVDGGGNVIVVGVTSRHGDSDLVTIKHSPDGMTLWTNYYGYVDGGRDWAQGWEFIGMERNKFIAVDLQDNVVVACQSESIAGDFLSQDLAMIKYSAGGIPLWTNRYGAANSVETFNGLVVDLSGNVVVTLHSPQPATIKYSNSGQPLWTNYFQGLPGSYGAGPGVPGVDVSGSVIVAGVSIDNNVDDRTHLLTIKYSESGAPLWTNAVPSRSGEYLSLAVDSDGAAIVLSRDSLDWFVIKLSAAGSVVWSNRYSSFSSGGARWDQAPAGVAVDAGGSVYVTGRTVNSLDVSTAVSTTIKFSSAGAILWTNFAAVRRSDAPLTIAADGNGNAFWTGLSWNGSNYDWATIKYAAEVAPPLLNIQQLGNNAVLSWSGAAFGLQSAPAITGTFTNIPNATSPYTNVISSGQRFFRLAQ